MKTAESNVFAELHTRLANEFLRRMTVGECKHCGRLPATIQELEAIRKFLSDNAITGTIALPPETNVMEGLPTFDEDDQEGEITRPAGSQ